MKGSLRRLGAIPSGATPHLPALATYMARAPLPPIPDLVSWTPGLPDWPMLANDSLGDCVPAALGHFIQAAERWHDGVGRMASIPDTVAIYESLGYNPLDPATDAGCKISDALLLWAGAGIPFHGAQDRVKAFVRVDIDRLKAALWLFGPLIVGVSMPIDAERQTQWLTPTALTGTAEPGSWGGHCMLLVGLNNGGVATLVSWGDTILATQGWLAAYMGEAWAVLHPVWVATGKSPAGWGEQALVNDMEAFR